MKLHLELLSRMVELPSSNLAGGDLAEIRDTLNELGLEVKDTEGEGLNTIFTIETLANRGDHLHALGVAREFSARLLTSIKPLAVKTELSERKSSVAVTVNTDKCLRYALQELRLPQQLRLRPEVSKIVGPESEKSEAQAIVQLLNYVQLEVGQPMHAFDQDLVVGPIVVEQLTAPAEIVALDGKNYKVPAESIVIKDREKIIAVAGVIGCANTMVSPSTKKVLVESATFDPVSVRKTARAMGLSTDASYAFERGTDPEGVLLGLKRLLYLAGAGVGGEDSVHEVGLSIVASKPLEKREVKLRLKEARRQLGLTKLSDAEISARLKCLGFTSTAVEGDVLSLTVPSWRYWDIRNEEDIFEELARTISLNKIKLDLPPLDYDSADPDPMDQLLKTIEPNLLGNGFSEVMTRSYYANADVSAIAELDPALAALHVPLKNSQERSYSHLKVTNIIQLAKLFEEHRRHGLQSFKVYEFSRLFFSKKETGLYEFERDTLSIAVGGRWYRNEWRKVESVEQKLSLLRGLVKSIFSGLYAELSFVAGENKLLHPGCQATIKSGRTIVGSIGLLHPLLKDRLGLKDQLIYCEIDAEALLKTQGTGKYIPPVDLPLVRRDLTLRVGLRDQAGQVIRYIESADPANLIDTQLIDDFKKDTENFRRVTYRLTFQNAARTLESSEVDKSMSDVLAHLASKHQLQLAD